MWKIRTCKKEILLNVSTVKKKPSPFTRHSPCYYFRSLNQIYTIPANEDDKSRNWIWILCRKRTIPLLVLFAFIPKFIRPIVDVSNLREKKIFFFHSLSSFMLNVYANETIYTFTNNKFIRQKIQKKIYIFNGEMKNDVSSQALLKRCSCDVDLK